MSGTFDPVGPPGPYPPLNSEQMPPQQSVAFAGFFGGNALTRWSASYIDTQQVVQDIQTLAAWCRANQNANAAILATFPTGLDGLPPGAVYWDGSVFSRAPTNPAAYPTSPTGLQSGDIYYSLGVYRVV